MGCFSGLEPGLAALCMGTQLQFDATRQPSLLGTALENMNTLRKAVQSAYYNSGLCHQVPLKSLLPLVASVCNTWLPKEVGNSHGNDGSGCVAESYCDGLKAGCLHTDCLASFTSRHMINPISARRSPFASFNDIRFRIKFCGGALWPTYRETRETGRRYGEFKLSSSMGSPTIQILQYVVNKMDHMLPNSTKEHTVSTITRMNSKDAVANRSAPVLNWRSVQADFVPRKAAKISAKVSWATEILKDYRAIEAVFKPKNRFVNKPSPMAARRAAASKSVVLLHRSPAPGKRTIPLRNTRWRFVPIREGETNSSEWAYGPRKDSDGRSLAGANTEACGNITAELSEEGTAVTQATRVTALDHVPL
ncbi:hypothetical protein GGX14DRAFT_408642 [Mycena pura]|uniref:Uncharacterized protein n=1 Tax=Mycena pura TaxID=153505 RepID=A0AAD6USQ6_9AGAR|nr:hypothetical protein GGX14DRAFT_408642 [Mycena pura]